jgi:Xaa-Pro aminopeptidase
MNECILKRTEKLRNVMAEKGAGAFIVIAEEGVNWESLYYMSGFRGTSGALIVYEETAELILDSRYIQQGREQSPHTPVEQQSNIVEDIRKSLFRHRVNNVLCEAKKTFHSTWDRLSACSGMELSDGTELMTMLRRTKDAHEIGLVRRAGEIGAAAFLDVLNDVRAGMTEKEFETLLNYKINKFGGETGFDMIVASGPRSAMPHGRPGDRIINAGEWVTVDFGVRYSGYFCDITRNFSIGEPDERASEFHDILLKAHIGAAGKLCAGASSPEVHRAASEILETHGIGKYFTHGVGHGFGLEIHEDPILSLRRCDILLPGDVVTIEPGVYIEGWGGLRLEDDYLVTETGADRLTDKLNQYFYRI